MTHTEKRVLFVLCRRSSWQWDVANCWHGFDALARDIRRTIRETRAAVHSLRDQGILELMPATDHDGDPCGSGYFLTRELRK